MVPGMEGYEEVGQPRDTGRAVAALAGFLLPSAGPMTLSPSVARALRAVTLSSAPHSCLGKGGFTGVGWQSKPAAGGVLPCPSQLLHPHCCAHNPLGCTLMPTPYHPTVTCLLSGLVLGRACQEHWENRHFHLLSLSQALAWMTL